MMAAPTFQIKNMLATSDDVHVVTATSGDEAVVLKVPASEEGKEAVLREARLLAVSEAPYFLGVSEGPLGSAIAMRPVGETLHNRALREGAPVLEADEALEWLHGGLATLRDLHACGIVHGDVCPSNLTRDSDGRVHAIDLGLASMLLPWTGKPGPRPARDWGKHVPDHRMDSGKGRPTFVSPNVHGGHLGTRRDDLISLFVSVAWAMTAGAPLGEQLPWMTLSPDEGEPVQAFFKRIGSTMRDALGDPDTRAAALGALPPEARGMFEVVYALGFAERPPYEDMLARLRPDRSK